ncbi:MAG: hypothetical protein GKR94_27590 [Gammaproteobacteria bacterium]|nr:hypothetical protein [Gammaproteobacteria bacterium]
MPGGFIALGRTAANAPWAFLSTRYCSVGHKYHRHVCSKGTCHQVDWKIGQQVWRWAKHRYPMKSARWVRRKYTASVPGRKWQFVGVDDTGCTREPLCRRVNTYRQSARRGHPLPSPRRGVLCGT